MTQGSANHYLRTRVLTASPQQLRLMLYDGAIKFCRRGREGLKRGDYDQMYDGVSRAQRIVLELAAGLHHAVEPDLCERMAALYDYLYRRLVDVNTRRDPAAIDDCLELLEHERQTWRMVMDRLIGEEGENTESAADREPRAFAASGAAAAWSAVGSGSSIGFSAEG